MKLALNKFAALAAFQALRTKRVSGSRTELRMHKALSDSIREAFADNPKAPTFNFKDGELELDPTQRAYLAECIDEAIAAGVTGDQVSWFLEFIDCNEKPAN